MEVITSLFKEAMRAHNYSFGTRGSIFEKVSSKIHVHAQTVRDWIREFEGSNCLSESQRGKHTKTSSPILDNQEFRDEFKAYVKENSKIKGLLFF